MRRIIYLGLFICSIASIKTQAQNIVTNAGTGIAGYSGDGGAATLAKLNTPQGIAVDTSGNLYIADYTSACVRKITPAGIISTYAGTGTPGYSGDGGSATVAKLQRPGFVAIDDSGNLYISDRFEHRIRKVNSFGIISTYAGTGTPGYSGDGGLATAAQIDNPDGLVVDNTGNLYFADALNNRIRKITPSGIISTIAGNGVAGFSGDGTIATSAELNTPVDIKIDTAGNLFISDGGNYRIRKITPTGIISTIAGTGVAGYGGDGGSSLSAQINGNLNLALDKNGNLFLSDNQRIREITSSGIIYTIAGNGAAGYSGDGSAAIYAELNTPTGLALSGSCGLYVADCFNSRIRFISGGAFAAPTTGSSVAYLGTPITLFNGDPGGSWSSVNTVVATVNTVGLVTPVSLGSDTIKYTVTNSCGTTVVSTPITVTTPIRCYIPTDGLVGWYPFTGSLVDSSGNTNNGINYGATLTTDRYGNPNSAYSFDGTSSFISIHDNPTLRPSDSLSIGAWVWIDTTIVNSFSGIVDKPVNVPSSFASYQLITGNVSAGQQGDPGLTTRTTAGYAWTADVTHSYCNQWMYVVGTWDGANMRCYQNGILVATVPQTGSIIYSADSITIGIRLGTYSTYGTDAFKGKIDDIVIYNRALTSCEVTRLYNSSCSINAISGTSSVCTGDSIVLSDTTSGGDWTISNSNATISVTGVVTGNIPGTDTVTYSITNSCGTEDVSKALTINPLPNAGVISGGDTVCAMETITLVDTSLGGIWSVTNGACTVSTGGVVTGVSSGTDTVLYTVANTCGMAIERQTITILAPGLCSTTGVQNLSGLLNIQIIPNPNNGNFIISGDLHLNTDELVSIEVTNILGQMVYHSNIECKNAKLNKEIQLGSIPNGVYFLNLSSRSENKQYKFIVE